jgi:hypothetical protein
MIKATMPDKAKHDDSIPDDTLSASGIYGLWLRVTCLSVLYFLKYQSASAKDFIFDEENIFFNFVCENMGFDPDTLRQKILRAIEKKEDPAPAPDSLYRARC